MHDGQGNDYVQQANGCLFFRTYDDTVYVTSGASAMAQGASFTLQNVMAFAQAKACP